MKPTLVTIGVYGFTEQTFFQALQNAHVDTLCDLRDRRGVRGPDYTFANSARLQRKLAELHIRYMHLKQLAPSQEVREIQYSEDAKTKTAKRKRSKLADAYREAYQHRYLDHLNAEEVVREIGEEAQVVGLLCVERDPEACHRSLVAEWLRQELGLAVEDIVP